MPTLFHAYRRQLDEICRANGVKALYVFGSAATDAFDPKRSDLDFQVDLGPDEFANGRDVVERYVGLYEGLVTLFHRPIDLITVESTGHPRFLAEVEATRQPLYGL